MVTQILIYKQELEVKCYGQIYKRRNPTKEQKKLGIIEPWYVDCEEAPENKWIIEAVKSELLIKQLTKEFKILSDEYKNKIMTLPDGKLEAIGLEIFDMKSIEDLKKYIN